MQHPPASGSDSPEPSKGVWKVGTLTYTTGGIVVLFLWLLWGDFAWSMRDRSVVGLASWYLNSLKIPNFVFAILMSSFPAVVSLLLGPIISMKSDRHRGKLGRRIPFLLLTTPVAALGMIGLGLTPFIAKWIHGISQPGSPSGDSLRHFFKNSSLGMSALGLLDNEIIVALVCFGVFWAAFEFATIAGLAVFGGLINDVVPQNLLGRFYGLFRAISLIDGMIFNFWIMGHVPEHFTLIIISIGVFYGIAFTWVCLKVKEGDYPPPPPLDPSHNTVIKSFSSGVKVYFKECFSNSYYILIFIMIMASTMSFLPLNTFAIPYAKSLQIDMATYGKYLALTYMFSLVLAFPLGWLADKFHPLRVCMVALVGYIIVSIIGFTYATTTSAYLVAWVLHGVLSGCYLTSAASIGQRLFPRQKFAQFASAALLFAAPLHMTLGPLVGVVIDSTGNSYRYTFAAGLLLACIGLFTSWLVYLRFVKLGGPGFYKPPA